MFTSLPHFLRKQIGTAWLFAASSFIFHHTTAQTPTIVGGISNPSEGTTTQILKDNVGGRSGIDPRFLTKVGNRLFFQATSSTLGDGLWKTDGTANGTVQLKTTQGYNIYETIEMEGVLYFVLYESFTGAELWRSDGTTIGTQRVKDIYTGSMGSTPNCLTVIGKNFYFVANDGINGFELWRSDGTTQGTRILKDIKIGPADSSPNQLTVLNGILYFSADDGSGMELWKSNGTTAGTVKVKDIYTGPNSSNPSNFTVVGSMLYFAADNGINGQELWTSDGTTAGTFMVKDIRPDAAGSVPRSLVAYDGVLYFSADDGEKGPEIWKSDGTAGGTVLFKDVNVGPESSNPHYLTVSNSLLFFVADNGTNGYELWKTGENPNSAELVRDINTQSGMGSNPKNLKSVNDVLFLVADDGIVGHELWCTDGRIDGTVLVKDIMANAAPSNIREMVEVGGVLYFAAANFEKGDALWRIDPCTIAAKIPNKNVSACGGSLMTVEGKSSSCLGVSYQWTSKPVGLTSNKPTLSTIAPEVSQPTNYMLYFKVSYGKNSTIDSVAITIKPQMKLSLRVMLEGPYKTTTGQMATTLNEKGILPGQKPISSWNLATPPNTNFHEAPWYYDGTEELFSYPSNVVDWVFVTLRTIPDNMASTVYRKPMLLQNDGYLAPVGCITLPTDKPYYVGIDHRNHLGILSQTPATVINSKLVYDFTKNQSYMNGFSYGQKKIGSVFVMYAGDFSKLSPTQIDAKDLNIWQDENGLFSQYIKSDANLDGEVNKLDKELHGRNNTVFSIIKF